MTFRRKSTETEPEAGPEVDEVTPEPGPTTGPYDIDDLPDDGVARMDLGSMLIAPAEGSELHLQVDEATGELRDTVPFPLRRLLPRQARWEGRVHEQVAPASMTALTFGLLLGHDGYTREAKERKDGRNIALLEAALVEHPNNPYYWYQLGTDHFGRQRYEASLPYLVEAYNQLHPVDGTKPQGGLRPWWHLVTVRLLQNLIALGKLEDAVALGEQEAADWADSSDFFYTFGDAVYRLGQRESENDREGANSLYLSAIGCWIHAVDQGDKQLYAGAINARATVLSARALVNVYTALNRPADAAKYAALAAGDDVREPVAASA